jgi:phosphate-selective porin OprO and OprP
LRKIILITLSCLFFINPGVSSADKTDKLLQLLIKKNIVTADEAKAIMEELDGDKESQVAKKRESIAADTSPTKPDTIIEAKYDKGVVFKTSDSNYSMKLNARFQGVYSYDNPEAGSSASGFRVRRARILASGNLYEPWLKYYTQVTLEGSSVAMRDFYVEVPFLKWLTPRMGQYKVPFDREFLNSAFNLQLGERSIASSEFSIERDIGFQVSGREIKGVFDYDMGIFNGSGANKSNTDNDYMYVVRISWGPYGSYPYSESAVDNPQTPKVAIGIAGAYMPGLDPNDRTTLGGRLGNSSVVSVESDVTQWTADLAYMYKRLSLAGGYYYREIDPKGVTLFGKQDARGVYIQGGYFLIPKHFEIAGRYVYIDPDNPILITDNEQEEYTIGLNYYFNGHNVKTGITYSYFATEKQEGDEERQVVRTSMTVQF